MILTRHHSLSCSVNSSGQPCNLNSEMAGGLISVSLKTALQWGNDLPCPTVSSDLDHILWRRAVRNQAGLHRSGSHCLRAACTFSSARMSAVFSQELRTLASSLQSPSSLLALLTRRP